MQRFYRTFMFLVFCSLFLSSIAFAQNYGKIQGFVTDAKTGEPLVGANVVIKEIGLGAASDIDGFFVILQVPPGSYEINCSYLGYQEQVAKGVMVRAGRISYQDFNLTETIIAGEEIVVVASKPVVEKDNTSTMRSVSASDISNLPVSTITEVIQIQAGAVNSDGLHLRGGRSGEVAYYIDGIPVNNPLTDEVASSQIVNNDAISEMQVISGTFSAEYGNAMSGIINITTQEGGNQLRLKLDSKTTNPGVGLESYSEDHNRKLIRLSLSGPFPVIPKTTVFVAGNYDDRDSYLPWGYRIERSIFTKLTSKIIPNIKLFVSGNFSNGIRKSYSHGYKYIPELYWIVPRTTNTILNIGLTHTINPTLFYTFNAYYTKYSYKSGDYDYRNLTSEYRLDSNNEFYTFNYVNGFSRDTEKTLGFKGDVVWQMNAHHEFKSGFDVKYHTVERFDINSPYENNHGLDNYKQKPVEIAAFLQDKVNFSNIIFSLGARFDGYNAYADYFENPYDAYYGNMEKLKSSKWHTQISPRVGMSFPVSSSTVFHFGYGHYFQRPDYIHMYKALAVQNAEGLEDKNGDGRVDLTDNYIMNLISGNGRFGNADLEPEKTVAYEFGVSHQLSDGFLLNVSVYKKNITNLLGVRTFFAGDSSADGLQYFETFSAYINEDFASNNGLEIQLKKKSGTHFVGEINYTLSVAEGSSSAPLERLGIEEANRQTLKFFPLNFDRRHSLNIYTLFKINRGELFKVLEYSRFSFLFKYGSGLPYTKGIRGTTAPYEINNMRLPENWSIDLKIDRKIEWRELSLIPYLEIYNLTNRKNVLYVDPFTGKPDQGIGVTKEYASNPLNWDMPRLIYVGLNIRFK
ncbi:MAG: hypothetical protein Kow00108_01680 [Calditrichia bacterium]